MFSNVFFWFVVMYHFIGKLLCDPHLLLRLACVLPLMETMQIFLKFAKRRDTFICNFIVTMNVYQGQLYTLYCNTTSSYQGDEFKSFYGLLQPLGTSTNP
jgi:hypothetical protein